MISTIPKTIMPILPGERDSLASRTVGLAEAIGILSCSEF